MTNAMNAKSIQEMQTNEGAKISWDEWLRISRFSPRPQEGRLGGPRPHWLHKGERFFMDIGMAIGLFEADERITVSSPGAAKVRHLATASGAELRIYFHPDRKPAKLGNTDGVKIYNNRCFPFFPRPQTIVEQGAKA